MSDFHEEFEGQAADGESVASAPGRAPEPESADVDAGLGGAGYGHSPAEPAAELDAEEPELATLRDDATQPAGPAEAPAEGDSAADPEDAPADSGDTLAPEDKAAQYLALAQRTQADFENYKKRAARDAALAQQRGITKLAKELLPAVDNLERAISHAPAEDPLLEGIKFVLSDLLAALGRAGIESFDPAGQTFDPTLHEAVAQFPKDGVDPGIVVEVYQPGYRLGDAVLRPARVVVAA